MTAHVPGQRIGHLELLELIGTGAFAEVWRARHHGALGFSREVAVKLLRPERETEEDSLRDLISEAALCAQLDHENIVQVHSVEQSGDLLVVEMEYVAGGSVKELLQTLHHHGLRLPRSAVAAIGAQVCAGLAYAWDGIRQDGQPFRVVHRDLKPANLLLTTAGRVRIADFGLAKSRDDTTQTAVGTIKGTPMYSAPEHLMETGEPIAPGRDLFALGCVLHELWTGRVLFDGDTLPAVVTQIVMGSPGEEVKPLRQEYPELAHLVEELLQRDPKNRPAQPAVVGARLVNMRASRPGDPGLGKLLDLVRAIEQRQAVGPEPLGTDDADWLALWRRARQSGGEATTILPMPKLEEPSTVPFRKEPPRTGAPLGSAPTTPIVTAVARPVSPGSAPTTPLMDAVARPASIGSAPTTPLVPAVEPKTLHYPGGRPDASRASLAARSDEKATVPYPGGEPDEGLVFDTETRELPRRKATPAPRTPPPPAPRTARPASPGRPRSGRAARVLAGVVVVLLIGIVGVLLLPDPASTPAPAASDGPRGCLVLGSSPPQADVWIDGEPADPAGDHAGAPRWHAPGEVVVAMGLGGVKSVETPVTVPVGASVRVVCALGDEPSCLVAKTAGMPCE